WDTGRVDSDQSIHVPYTGPALASAQRYSWRVRIWDGEDAASDWSEPAIWEMGLLDASDWTAKWITPDWEEDPKSSQPSPMLRKEFDVGGAVKSARAYVTSLGLYEMELNGARVGDELFTPGWTSYSNRLQYQTYDVTAQLKSGRNAIGVMLGDGWYRGFLGRVKRRAGYGRRPAL
ncbi:MAG: alpha-L-rhamnosidase, partial [bacterium]|nr:alpha-L-rhamnosidase [bacterium]